MMNKQTLWNLRQAVGLSVEEAASLIHVTGRTWNLYEDGTQPIPLKNIELFAFKVGQLTPPPGIEWVIIHANKEVLDVIASDLFVEIVKEADGNYAVRALGIDRETKRPWVRTTRFNILGNVAEVNRLMEWKGILKA